MKNYEAYSKAELKQMCQWRDKQLKDYTRKVSIHTHVKMCEKLDDLEFDLTVANRVIKEYQNWFRIHSVIPSDNNYKMMYIGEHQEEAT